MSYLKKNIMVIMFYLFRIFKINKNKIVICNYLGRGFGDNGKYIVKELLKRGKKYDIVWLVKNTKDEFPDGVRAVKYNSIRSVYEQVTARLWIDNRRKPGFVRKRIGQVYIMTWHAGLGLKRAEGAALDALSSNYIAAAKNDSKMANLFLSNSRWTTEMYKNYFWYDGAILEKGLPREDILFQRDDNLRISIFDKYNINPDCKVVLYAPTFRKSRLKKELILYNIDWEAILKTFSMKFGGKWVGMIRLHPNITEQASQLVLPSGVIDVSEYPDMQELLAVSNVLITDYSSCIFDFGATCKPAFIYAPDLDDYKKDRNFWFEFEDLPFGVAESQGDLIDVISNYNAVKYKEHIKQFYEKCGFFDGGEASKYVADYIDDCMN